VQITAGLGFMIRLLLIPILYSAAHRALMYAVPQFRAFWYRAGEDAGLLITDGSMMEAIGSG